MASILNADLQGVEAGKKKEGFSFFSVFAGLILVFKSVYVYVQAAEGTSATWLYLFENFEPGRRVPYRQENLDPYTKLNYSNEKHHGHPGGHVSQF